MLPHASEEAVRRCDLSTNAFILPLCHAEGQTEHYSQIEPVGYNYLPNDILLVLACNCLGIPLLIMLKLGDMM